MVRSCDGRLIERLEAARAFDVGPRLTKRNAVAQRHLVHRATGAQPLEQRGRLLVECVESAAHRVDRVGRDVKLYGLPHRCRRRQRVPVRRGRR